MERILQIEDVRVSFETRRGLLHAVRGVSFDLNAGETLAIVGESGSGKSVMAKTIMNIFSRKDTFGNVNYKNRNLLDLSEKEMATIRGREISYVMQDSLSSLNPTMKIGNQISETIIKHLKVDPKTANKRAIELIEAVGIKDADKRFNQYPHEFSGGMRQRIVIAIAICCNPKILIADEPTTALDVSIQAQILQLIKDLQKDMRTSIIFISHDMGVVAKMADRIAVMYAGQIIEIGTKEEIFNDPRHPYTWGLLASIPSLDSEKGTELISIEGTPPDPFNLPSGCAFAPRNPNALAIDFEEEPPMFQISKTHFAKTWMLHEGAPTIEPPEIVKKNLHAMPENFKKAVRLGE